MKIGDYIKISYDGKKHKVKVLKIFEWVKKDIAGFIKVEFSNKQVANISICE